MGINALDSSCERLSYSVRQCLGAGILVVSIKLDPVSRPLVNVVDKTFMKASATAAPNGRYALRETTLGTLIEAAYGVRDFQMRSRRWACRWRR